MGLDAADWANIMIPHIRFGVNPAPKKVRCEPDAPPGSQEGDVAEQTVAEQHRPIPSARQPNLDTKSD
jgi:hypothetical protein